MGKNLEEKDTVLGWGALGLEKGAQRDKAIEFSVIGADIQITCWCGSPEGLGRFYEGENFKMSLQGCVGFLSVSNGKEYACHVADPGSIPGLGRSPGEENGYPLQYFCPENSMDRERWQAIVHGIAKSWTWPSN